MLDAHSPIVRGADIGYGFTKLTAGVDARGALRCTRFQSLAPPAPTVDVRAAGLAQRKTIRVTVSGATYEVGADADLLMTRQGMQRVLHDDYVHSDQYLALLRGALAMMDTARIDLLVLGLPVHLMEAKREVLRTLATGTHAFPDRGPVQVERAEVVPQPVGALVDYVRLQQGQHPWTGTLDSTTYLLVDPGFYTLDWVAARGLTPIPQLSGSTPYGMSVVLQAMADEIGRTTGAAYENLAAIDEGLRTDRFSHRGKAYELKAHLPAGLNAILPGLMALENAVGRAIATGAANIRGVLVAGGPAELYVPLLRRMLPDHDVLTLDDPAYANVRGFYEIGMASMRQARRAA